jgi:hypothetical protein
LDALYKCQEAAEGQRSNQEFHFWHRGNRRISQVRLLVCSFLQRFDDWVRINGVLHHLDQHPSDRNPSSNALDHHAWKRDNLLQNHFANGNV